MRHGPILLVRAAAMALAACTGADVQLRADRARYPISMSDGLTDQGGKLHLAGRDLVVVGRFEERYMEWSTLYGAVHGDEQVDLSEDINAAVEAHGGEAVTGLSVQASNCAFNWFLILNWLPFWPGCTVIDVDGYVVRRAEVERGR